MLSNTQLFCVGYEQALNDFHLYKFTFGNFNADFAKKIQCTSTPWTASVSETLLSSDKSIIYSLFIYGGTTYFNFVALNSTSGSVIGSRYKSSISWNYVHGSTINADYIAATLVWPDYFLVLLNSATSDFTINKFTGNYLYGVEVEPFLGR